MTENERREREALSIALDALDEIALAGMSGTGMESEEAMTEWHARQAWKFIGIAARAKDAARASLSASTPSAEARCQINLEPEESALLALLCAPGDEAQEVTLSIGDGHGGYGLYAWETEYPEEGATFIAAMAPPADNKENGK